MPQPEPTEPELRIDVDYDGILHWSYHRPDNWHWYTVDWELRWKDGPIGSDISEVVERHPGRTLHITGSASLRPIHVSTGPIYIHRHINHYGDPFSHLGWFPDTLKVLRLSHFPLECESIRKIKTLTEFALLPGSRIHDVETFFRFLKKNPFLENVELTGEIWNMVDVDFPTKRRLKKLKTLTIRVKDTKNWICKHDVVHLIPCFSPLPKDAHLIVEVETTKRAAFNRALSYVENSAKPPTNLWIDCHEGKLEFSTRNSKNKVSLSILNDDPAWIPTIDSKLRKALLGGEPRLFFKEVEVLCLRYYSKPLQVPNVHPCPRSETLKALLILFPALKKLTIEEVFIEAGDPPTRTTTMCHIPIVPISIGPGPGLSVTT